MSMIALLDGGLGQEINKQSSADTSHPLWSVKVMEDEPDIVKQVHKAFLQAGARTIATNSYTITQSRLDRNGYPDAYERLHKTALQIVKQAVDEVVADGTLKREDIAISGCLPPVAASYVAEAALDYEASKDEYLRIIETQRDHVDVFLVETMSNIEETKAAIDALAHYGQAAYVALTLADDGSNQLRSGEPLSRAMDELGAKGVEALMLNCSYPEAIGKAIPELVKAGFRTGGYANGFTSISALAPGQTVDNLSARQDLSPARYFDHVKYWLDEGATIIGGCCEISPAHIAYMHDELISAGYQLEKLA